MIIFEKESKKGCILPEYIEIKDSDIIGAGKGAFAKINIPKGKTIGRYIGEEYIGEKINEANGDYLFSVNYKGKEVKIIDGKDEKKSSWVRFVNTPLKKGDGNCYFFQRSQGIYIRTNKNIKKGEEILAYYGDDYVYEKIYSLRECL
jgi:predicted nucleic acid-binding Zn finger protein